MVKFPNDPCFSFDLQRVRFFYLPTEKVFGQSKQLEGPEGLFLIFKAESF